MKTLPCGKVHPTRFHITGLNSTLSSPATAVHYICSRRGSNPIWSDAIPRIILLGEMTSWPRGTGNNAQRSQRRCDWPASLEGVNTRWKIALVGPFREPATAPDWTSQIRGVSLPAGTQSASEACSKSSTPLGATGSIVTSFDLAVALSVARHLCVSAHRVPWGPRSVQTGLRRAD